MNSSIFTEAVKSKKDGEDYTMTAKILPFGRISRNNVMYDKESVLNTHSKLVGKPVLYNHKAQEGLPRGEWISTEVKTDGLYGTAKIYNTSYNKELIEYLSHASNPTVSLEVVGDAEKRIDEMTGKQYGLAKVKDWLEASIVNVPGFEEAKVLSFEYFISESLGLGIQSLDNGGISVTDFKEIFDRLDKHEALMEKMVGFLEKLSEPKPEVKSEAKADDKKEDSKEEVKSEAKADDKKEDKKEEVKSEAKKEVEDSKEDKAEDKKEEVKSEAKKEDSKEAEDKKEEVKSEAKAEDKKENSKEEIKSEAKVEDKKDEVQKEEVRTVDERDNKPDVQKPEDSKVQDKMQKPEVKEDEPKKPVTVKESARISEKKTTGAFSNKDVIWNEMLKRHFGN